MPTSRVGYAGTTTAGDTITAANNNKNPAGAIGSDVVVSAATAADGQLLAIATTVRICTTTVTVGTNRRISAWACGKVFQPSGALPGSFQTTLREDGVVLNRVNWHISTLSDDNGFCVFAFSNAPSAGSHTYDLVVGINGVGQPPVSVHATSAAPAGPCWLMVCDEGISF